MLPQQTLAGLHALKLFGLAQRLPERLTSPQHADLTHADFVGLLVQHEQTYRDNQRLTRLLRHARLKHAATLEDIDYAHPRGLANQVILELSTTHWITASRNVLLTGPTGVGKSYLACAFGHLAARRGAPVLYVREGVDQAQQGAGSDHR
jgi:DNA replication protein DnaC